MDGYEVVTCKSCGAGYANGIPSQPVFDRYYGEMSKYEHSYRDGKVSDVDAARFSEVVDLAGPHVKPTDRIVDVGCATGALLAEFQRRGFTNLQGYDPSVSCSEAAKRLYGIEVAVSSINGLNDYKESADLVIMTGVLEHLADVDTSLRILKGMLASSGMIYLEVPDASRYDEWFSAPYQFFSMEHVNFFSPQSLTNLLARHGFAPVFTRRVKRFIGSRSVEPGIAGLFSINTTPHFMVPDLETKPRLQHYAEQSRQLEESIHQKISEFVQSRKSLAVWGTGTHTLRLLETSQLKEANIVAFLDSNSRYHGKTLHGVLIENPDTFHHPEAAILVSSHMAQQEIVQTIRVKLGWKNDLVCFYEDAPISLS